MVQMVIYEDAEVYIVHKPPGMSAQEDPAGGDSVLSVFPGAHCITRLDKRVSGLMILAKNAASARTWTQHLQEGKIGKVYHCVVANRPEPDSGELMHWIRKEAKARVFKQEEKVSKQAVLHYRVLRSSDRYHLLEVQISTGRFHQIRAQLAAAGSPIVGDLKYGFKRSSPDGSLFLCCTKISMGDISVEIPLPEVWGRYGV